MLKLPELSTYAGQIDHLILLIAVLTGFWFLVAEGVFFWLIFKFRAKPGVKSQYLEGHEHHVERFITWPHRLILLCDVAIIFFAVQAWYNVKQRLPEADSTIRVIGQQASPTSVPAPILILMSKCWSRAITSHCSTSRSRV